MQDLVIYIYIYKQPYGDEHDGNGSGFGARNAKLRDLLRALG